jgi:uncharacterized protein
MTTDKTGAPTSVSAAADKFTIAVDGQHVGLTAFVDRYEGRGLATILVSEASYLDKHRDFDDVADPVTGETEQFLREAVHTG